MQKYFLTALASLFFFTTTLAQKVTIKDEVVYSGDQPQFRIIRKGMTRFTVRNLAGEDLIIMQHNPAGEIYNINFLGSGAVCKMIPAVGLQKMFVRALVDNEVIVAGKINPQGEKLFLQQHEGEKSLSEFLADAQSKRPAGRETHDNDDEYTDRPAGSNGQNPYQTVTRNRNQQLLIFGNKLKQDNVIIGTYATTTSAGMGNVFKVITFSLPNGEVVAEATLDAVGAKSARVVLLKNGQVVTLPLKSFMDSEQAKELGGYLVSRYIL